MIAPFSPAFGTLTIDCEGTVHVHSFEMKNDTEIVKFPIKKEWVPGITLRVELNGGQYRTNELGQNQMDKPKRLDFFIYLFFFFPDFFLIFLIF